MTAGSNVGIGARRVIRTGRCDGAAGPASIGPPPPGEAIELGSKVGALIGLGIAGEEGFETGARRGADH